MRIYIDKETGTWGDADDLLITKRDIPQTAYDILDQMTDSQRVRAVELLKAWEEEACEA